ncbi:hypothetical protein CPC08DRAFT_765967 [Agrocybe pediades]|nr:hypothetical protein CPC08DRAFT_765967 [Agrocybe pediades]
MKSIHSSVFPQELFDYVIDEVAKSADSHSCQEESRAQRLAALALVSRSFRTRAYRHLFEKVRLANMDKDIQGPRVRLLVELLKANGRLASYITSLTLIIHPSDSDVQRDTAYILRALFNDKNNSAPCSLAVRLKGRLEKDTEQALFEICHKPRLASLHLADYPFPCNFLKYTFIKHLTLYKVKITKPVPEHVFETVPGRTVCGEVVRLESLFGSGDTSTSGSYELSLNTSQSSVFPAKEARLFCKTGRGDDIGRHKGYRSSGQPPTIGSGHIQSRQVHYCSCYEFFSYSDYPYLRPE